VAGRHAGLEGHGLDAELPPAAPFQRVPGERTGVLNEVCEYFDVDDEDRPA